MLFGGDFSSSPTRCPPRKKPAPGDDSETAATRLVEQDAVGDALAPTRPPTPPSPIQIEGLFEIPTGPMDLL